MNAEAANNPPTSRSAFSSFKAQRFMDSHPDNKTVRKYADVYEWFVREVFFERQSYYEDHKKVTQYTIINYREFLERYFVIKF